MHSNNFMCLHSKISSREVEEHSGHTNFHHRIKSSGQMACDPPISLSSSIIPSSQISFFNYASCLFFVRFPHQLKHFVPQNFFRLKTIRRFSMKIEISSAFCRILLACFLHFHRKMQIHGIEIAPDSSICTRPLAHPVVCLHSTVLYVAALLF
jgi:hypothetical protein